MKIALLGYGKMGKAIERLALERDHTIMAKIDADNLSELTTLNPENCDVIIEFSQPSQAFENIKTCLKQGLTVISGTTGWLENLPEIEKLVEQENGCFLHASNFSVGVNIFFMVNEFLAEKMMSKPYSLNITESHHTEKLDSPSGTAVKLAEGIMDANPTFKSWLNEKSTDPEKIEIISLREPNVPGTHTVSYESSMEKIDITHTAHTRDIFASGAIDVAEWIKGKKGFLTIKHYLQDLF